MVTGTGIAGRPSSSTIDPVEVVGCPTIPTLHDLVGQLLGNLLLRVGYDAPREPSLDGTVVTGDS
jgi:hypothetical protein